MYTDLYSSGFVRYPSTGSFTGTSGITMGPVVSNIPASTALVKLGSDKSTRFRNRGVQLAFSANADNATGNFSLWARGVFVNVSGSEFANGPVISLGSGTFTAGNLASPANASDFLADTITFTPSTYLTNLLTTLGAAAPLIHSPADNTIALLRIEDLGNHDLYVNVWVNVGSSTDIEVYAEVNT